MELGSTPGVEPDNLLLRVIGEPLASAEIDESGRFELRGLRQRHLRLRLEHRFYSLTNTQIVHAPGDVERHDCGELPVYCGGHVLGRILGDVPPPGTSVRLTSELQPMTVLQDPQLFLAHSLRQGGAETAPDERGRFEFQAVMPAPSVSLEMRGDDVHGRVPALPLLAGEVREVLLIPEPTGSLRAAVRDEQGEPVADANVTLLPAEGDGQFTLLRSAHSGRTDDAGEALLGNIAPGPWSGMIERPGYLPASFQIAIRPDTDLLHEVVLDRGPEVRGRVIDANGQPVSEARVALWQRVEVPIVGDVTRFAGTNVVASIAERSPVTSDAEGRFVVGGAAADQEWSLAVVHPDFASMVVPIEEPPGVEVVVTMQREARIHGRAVDTDGQPLPQFTARLLDTSMMFFSRPVVSRRIEASTTGEFELTGIPPGNFEVEITTREGGLSSRDVSIEPAADLDVGDVEVAPPCTVHGRVLDADGTPLAGAEVRPSRGGLADNPVVGMFLGSVSATTDDTGSFELAGLPGGAVKLMATSEAAATGYSAVIRLAPGETREGIDILLETGGTIEGRLLGLNPGEAHSWQILCTRDPQSETRAVTLQADGSFRAEHLSPGSYQVQALNMGTMSRLNTDLIRNRSGNGIPDIGGLMRQMQDVTLTERARLRGTETVQVELDVLDLTVEGVTLEVTLTGGSVGEQKAWAEITNVDQSGAESLRMAFLDGNQLTADRLRQGLARVQLRSGLTMAALGPAFEVELPDSSGVVELRVELPSGQIAGVVVTADTGEPLVGAPVRLSAEADAAAGRLADPGFALTDQQGRFRFAALEPGSYSVVADERFLAGTSGAARIDDLRLSAGEIRDDLVLRIAPGGGTTVLVTGPGGAPVSRARVYVVDAQGNPATVLPSATMTDADGQTTLAGLATGNLRAIAWSDGLAPGVSAPQRVEPGVATEMRVDLRPGTSVALELVDDQGRPLAGAQVAVRLQGTPWIPTALFGRITDARGRIELGPLPPGPVDFAVTHPRAHFERRRVIPSGARAAFILQP